jgi:uncharacterized protein (TIGR01777 family)
LNESFEQQLHLPVTAEEAFTWHGRPGALERLIPPWEPVEIAERGEGIQDGSIVKLRLSLGPMKLTWVAKHHDCQPGRSFRDTQISGPFAHWEHLHDFQVNGDGNGILTDYVEYQAPGGTVGRLLGSSFIERKLKAMFAYRHKTTSDDLALHAKYCEQGPMNVAVTGSNGLVGSTLIPMLTTGGHRVTKLVRGDVDESDIKWDPQANTFNATALDGVEAVVHLAGGNIAAARWNAKVKEKIRSSRVHGTRVLCEGLAKMPTPPKALICASAIGFYGDRGDEVLTEESTAGSGFLAKVAQEWEGATAPAREAGIRVVHLRFGVILSPRGGALAKMLLPFKLGMGGRVGSGRQYWSWISVDDAAGAIHHALMTDSLRGPVNAVAPHPVTNTEFTKTLGHVLGRPTIAPMPAFAARLVLGEMVEELLLASTRVEPQQLIRSGYKFRQPSLEVALQHLLGRAGSSLPIDPAELVATVS